MKIRFVSIGVTGSNYLQEGIDEYKKRLGFFIDFQWIELPALKQSKSMKIEEIKKREAELIKKEITKSDVIVLLDEKGKEYTSREMAEWLNKLMLGSVREISFVCGGAYGFATELYTLSNGLLSLSKLTFTHQMVRLVFVEQLYRSFTILKGIPYHND